MYLGGRGNVPRNAGITVSKALLSPRFGIAYRLDDKTVIRAGYGLNYDPMPFSRPLRGMYPITVTFDFNRDNTFTLFRSLEDGIPPVDGPDLSRAWLIRTSERRLAYPLGRQVGSRLYPVVELHD